MNNPNKHLAPPTLCHVALSVVKLDACVDFYTRVLKMTVEWQPDKDNFYLTSGRDNLALHRVIDNGENRQQRLDHIGFILPTPEDVDSWYEMFLTEKITIKAQPRTHRDGARSFYAYDPDGTVIQMIYHPPLAGI